MVPAVGDPDLSAAPDEAGAPASRSRPIVLNGRAAVRPTITGVERWATELIPRLQRLRPDRYVVLDPPPPLRSKAAGQAWEQLVLPVRARGLRAALVLSPANLAPWAWPRNVVVVHDAAVLRDEGAFSRGYRMWHARFGMACARRALKVVTVSQFSRQELIELAGLHPESVVVIHGGVDARFVPAVDSEPVAARYGLSRPYALTVGTDDRRKNLPALVATAHRLGELGIELVWAGESRSYIGRGAPIDGLRSIGYVDDDDLPGLYAGASAFVLPSLYEGFGLPCLEAMACGTPVVAANRAALPETCGAAALLVDPEDHREIAEAVVRVVTDDQLRARLRAAGLERSAHMTWDHAAAKTDALLHQLASR